MDWKIWYADASCYTSAMGQAYQAPSRGVLVIIQKDSEVGRSFWKQCDFYWWIEASHKWVGGDMAGLLDHLAECRFATVLQGRTVTDTFYRATVRLALDDPDFPRKSAKYERERLDGQTL